MYRFACLAALLMFSPSLQAQATLKGCASDALLPPFGHYDPDSARRELVGLGVDVLQAVLRRAGLPPVDIAVLPWQRCLRLVETGKIDIALNVPTAQINPRPYYISQPYYTLHSLYFSRKLRANPVRINELEDLKRYQVCGLFGYRFEGYGIDSATVDTGSKDYGSLIKKIHAGRCDLFIEKREIVAGMYLIDPALQSQILDPTLDSQPLPEETPLQLHFAISRRSQGGEALRQQINEGIAELTQRDEINRMMARYQR